MNEDFSKETMWVFLSGWLMVVTVILTGVFVYVGALNMAYWSTVIAIPLTGVIFLTCVLYSIYRANKG